MAKKASWQHLQRYRVLSTLVITSLFESSIWTAAFSSTISSSRQLHFEKSTPTFQRVVPGSTILEAEKIIDSRNSNGQISDDIMHDNEHNLVLDRRWFLGAALVGGGSIIGVEETFAVDFQKSRDDLQSRVGKLQWESTPINKRTGVTVFDAEKAGYNIRFVTYLARFLLAFDADCQKWWYSKAADIPRRATAEEVSSIRLEQFGAFAASVEVGLQEYEGANGPSRLMDSLLARYCPPNMETVRAKRAKLELPPQTEAEENKERREIKEARRQIALLFGLMEVNQPVDRITQLLAAIANGSIASVEVKDGGSGYAPGYGAPLVSFPQPKAGPEYQTARGRAVLKPNGRILRYDLKNRGFGYQKPPAILVSSPGADRGVVIPGTRPAIANAVVFKNGINKGRLERIELVDPGEGYEEGERIRILIDPPELPASEGGLRATAEAILEYSIAAIEVTDGGSGYAVEKPIPVSVESPPLTSRVNMNDPLMARLMEPTKALSASTIPTPQQRKRSPDLNDPDSFTSMMDKLAKNDGKGGGGGCLGRACYDTPVTAYATAKAETSSFSTFRIAMDSEYSVNEERKVIGQVRVISGATGGTDSQQPVFYSGSKTSSSAQLLTLLPAGFGLEYNQELERYELSAGQDFTDVNDAAGSILKLPLDPTFGPRGRSPIERDLTLDLPSFLRFCASGAICASGAHLILTPLDVVKTKIQTDPERYPGVVRTFKKLISEAGPTGFFAGWYVFVASNNHNRRVIISLAPEN